MKGEETDTSRAATKTLTGDEEPAVKKENLNT